ncbi:hypothetical protein H6P81_006283 [Aristolochia fimbriata]|uniref:Uncharacterized protein n=1 Tax=Aristolochia fimbriata TaxID=158543 RepID=A0AAV7EY22_ARIFI|nr:hypothetical protein H6P81_006283 [Aristolochia fimbriata]
MTEEKAVEVTEEKAVEVTEEKAVEVTEEKTVEVTEEKAVEVTEEKAVEVTEEKAVEVTEEKAVEVTEEKAVEVTGEKAVEVTEEKAVEVTEEKAVEETGEAAEVTGEAAEVTEEEAVEEEEKNIPAAAGGTASFVFPYAHLPCEAGEVRQARQLAHALRQRPRQLVPGDIQLHHLPQPEERIGQHPRESVRRDVQHLHVPQPAHLRRQAPGQIIIAKHDLVHRLPHPPDAVRDAPHESIVGEDGDGGGGVAEVVRQLGPESVVVEEDRVDVLVEEGGRERSLEAVEPEVEVAEVWDGEDGVREGPHEAVVAEVELVEKLQFGDGVGEEAAEAVGVDVEEREVGHVSDLRGEVAGDVGAVEVDAGDDHRRRVVQGLGAEDAVVGAHVGADPVAGEVVRVGVDRMFQSLEGLVGPLQAGVGERQEEVHVVLEVVGEFAAVTEAPELPTADEVHHLRVGQGGGEGDHKEEEEADGNTPGGGLRPTWMRRPHGQAGD